MTETEREYARRIHLLAHRLEQALAILRSTALLLDRALAQSDVVGDELHPDVQGLVRSGNALLALVTQDVPETREEEPCSP